MAEAKTQLTGASVDSFLKAIKDEQVRKDCQAIAAIMQKATKAKPEMWGTSMVGFGRRRLTYANGREADFMEIAFAPRKTNITLYISSDFEEYEELAARLGPHGGTSKSCLHIKRLSDLHIPTLTKLVKASVAQARKTQPPQRKS
jgi:hypothetical protein